jgi:hypothetical protein
MYKSWNNIDYMAYPHLRNTTVKWLPNDSKEKYLENLNGPNKELLKEWNWIDKEIEYRINQHGFRSPRFTAPARQSILFLGCSYTVGIGLPIEQTWPYQVADHLGLVMYNLGIGGGSNDSCYRIGSHWIPKLKPRHVFVLSPFAHRLETVRAGGNFDSINVQYPQKNGDYLQWLEYELNSELNRQRTQDALKYICLTNGVTYNTMTADDFIIGANAPDMACARDLLHPGIEHNRNTALKVIELYS